MFVLKDESRSPVCRFGVAGDFLPAAGLAPAASESWSERAELLRPLFRDLEFSIANLECPVNVGGMAPRIKASLGDTFSAEPEALDYLSSLRVNVVGLANNHLYDYGRSGASKTLETVKREFSPCGFGHRLDEPPDVHIRDAAAGMRVGVWAAARNLPDNATRNAIGIEPATRERAAQALAQMAASKVQCSVAFIHAGAEGTNYPDPEDVEFTDRLGEMGFDVIAACHSHRVSGYKAVRSNGGRLAHCFYGLGSMASGVLYSPLEHEGVVAAIALDSRGDICQIEARPIYLDARGWGTAPSAQAGDVINDRFRRVSAAIADESYRQAFYREVSRDLMGTQWRDARIAFQRAGLLGLLKKVARMRPAHVRRLYHKSLSRIGLG
jgi:hypothetical protein